MKLVLAPHVFAREFEGELVLLDLDGGEYFGLDAVGATIWRSLGTTGTLDAAVAAVVAEFDVAEPRAREDVAALVAELEHRGIVQREP